ncbi:hypothetical protein CUMW_224410, partial [Citrus unshiu]
ASRPKTVTHRTVIVLEIFKVVKSLEVCFNYYIIEIIYELCGDHLLRLYGGPLSRAKMPRSATYSAKRHHAFESKDAGAHQFSELFRKKIVAKCGGLPLAASTLGGLLRTRHTEDAWEDIVSSKMWDLPQQTDILAVLRGYDQQSRTDNTIGKIWAMEFFW